MIFFLFFDLFRVAPFGGSPLRRTQYLRSLHTKCVQILRPRSARIVLMSSALDIIVEWFTYSLKLVATGFALIKNFSGNFTCAHFRISVKTDQKNMCSTFPSHRAPPPHPRRWLPLFSSLEAECSSRLLRSVCSYPSNL